MKRRGKSLGSGGWGVTQAKEGACEKEELSRGTRAVQTTEGQGP